MAAPLKAGKQPIRLAPDGTRISRIRRDPPPKVKQKPARDPEELDRRAVAIGVLSFGLAIVVIVLAFGSWAGWSPSQYTVVIGETGADRESAAD